MLLELHYSQLVRQLVWHTDCYINGNLVFCIVLFNAASYVLYSVLYILCQLAFSGYPD
jgi:hypothetical protein